MMVQSSGSLARHGLISLDGSGALRADVDIPESPRGVVIFAHGSGSSRLSPRNQHVAMMLNGVGLATVLVDLLTPEEEAVDLRTTALRFNIPLLTDRLRRVVEWVAGDDVMSGLQRGLFGASTGAAAALACAAHTTTDISAIVSRGGRPDLAANDLQQVQTPTLFIVGERDRDVLELTRTAARQMACERQVSIVPGATHLFEEPGRLDQVAELAAAWFVQHMSGEHSHVTKSVTQVVRTARTGDGVQSAAPFADRDAAGLALANMVAESVHGLVDPIIVGLPRGGIVVATHVARAVNAPMTVLSCRKIGAPSQPELALAAVDEDGVLLTNLEVQQQLRATPRSIEQLAVIAHQKAQSQASYLRDGRPLSGFAGRDVLLVDDGYATGMTARSAARFLRRHGARRVLLAVPVGPADLVSHRPVEFNEVFCLRTPEPFHAVGLHYRSFDEVTDTTARTLLHTRTHEQYRRSMH